MMESVLNYVGKGVPAAALILKLIFRCTEPVLSHGIKHY